MFDSKSITVAAAFAFALTITSGGACQTARHALHEVNSPLASSPDHIIAIVGANLVDGRGGAPIPDSVVVVRGDKITAAGPRGSVRIPKGAEVVKAEGMTLVPGLMDSHFHIERDYNLPRLYLFHGVTSLRDPGQWNYIYDPVVQSKLAQPRFFLCGPHLDNPPVAYPLDSFVVKTPEETRAAINRFVDEGASGITVYFRLPE